MSAPFIVYGLPRTRTYWLSQFLSYVDVRCYHEQSMFMRTIDDVKSWFSQDDTGTCETAAGPGWRLIHHYRPDIKAVVVKRPIKEVMTSISRLDYAGIGHYESASLGKMLSYLDRILDQISSRPNVLTVSYNDLSKESVCARIFEHCLPYEHDHMWWADLHAQNLQCDSRAILRYRFAHRKQMEGFKLACWSELKRLVKTGEAFA